MKNFVITGSNGWFSHNFKNSLKKQKNHNVNLHEVDAQNAETVLNKITDLNIENIYLIHNGYIKPKVIKSRYRSIYRKFKITGLNI